jgi:toxin ParE1/3/4
MDIIWLDPALDDLYRVQVHISEANPAAAKRVVQDVVRQVAHLTEQPHMGRSGRVVGTRELVVSGTPYIVPYRVKRNRVEVLRVFHGAQSWPDHL